jgi:hypothetical protein
MFVALKAIVKSEHPLGGDPIMKRSTTLIMLLLFTLVSAGCADPRKPVNITLTIETPRGGVFAENSCQPQGDYANLLSGVQIHSITSASNIDLPILNWKLTTPTTCAVVFETVLNSEELYQVIVDGAPMDKIDKSAIDGGSIALTRTISPSRTISGRIRLYQQASYSAEYPSGLSVVGFLGRAKHFDDIISNISCKGYDRYQILAEGAVIIVTDNTGKELERTVLHEGTLDNIVLDHITTYCDFKFTFSGVPYSASGYNIQWNAGTPGQDVEVGQTKHISVEIDIAYPEGKARKASPSYCGYLVGPDWDYTNPKVCWAP